MPPPAMRPFALLVVLATLAACGDRQPATAEPDAEATPPQAAETPTDSSEARPATGTTTITVEGEPQEVPVRLVRFDDLDLPFSTYVPEGWTDDVLGSGEGAAAFIATSDGPDRGFVSVFVPSEPNREGITEIARAAVESRGEVLPMEDPADWVEEGYTFSGIDEAGAVRIGSHAGVPFYVLEAYPVEMGDGFPPRAQLVVDRLRWADDGTGL